MKIIRVFPRKTRLTPIDENTRIDCYPSLFDEADEIHISVTFTDDLPRAEHLANEWKRVSHVRVGGPATGERGEAFEPGFYLKTGAVITSRGCPNRCWFCSVWRREGESVRELPIRDGWNVLDDNLLRCSEKHIRSVFSMLERQPKKATFTGGLESAALKDWHIDLLAKLRPEQMFFAYDEQSDFEPLQNAGKRLQEAGFNRHHLRAYCLIGYPLDTLDKAEKRLHECVDAGFYPMAMLYRDGANLPPREWKQFQRVWARPACIYSKIKEAAE